MRIAVIGAGVVGVTTAYELASDGHAVTVLERHSGVAGEASFAHAGLTMAGWTAPWADGGARSGPLAGLLFGKAAGLRLRPSFDPAQWRWLRHWWAASNAADSRRHREALLRLGAYSRERLAQLSDKLQLDFERADGLLLLLRGERELAAVQPTLALLREAGVALRELDAAGCHAIEPGLDRDAAIAAGVHVAQAGIGNCRQFVHLVREAAERMGVEFRFATVVRAIEPGADTASMLRLEQTALTTGFVASRASPNNTQAVRPQGMPAHRARAAARYLDPVSQESFDAVVVAAGVDSAALLDSIGLKLPLMPVYGYSLTAPLRATDRGPRAAVLDVQRRMVLGRLGQRVRVAGGAELGGSPRKHRTRSVNALYDALNDWFPGSAHTARPQVWKGARPMLPDGPPLVGPSPRPGVWLNLGHGGSGWALACGSARLLADQIGGRAPAVDPSALQPSRYGRALQPAG